METLRAFKIWYPDKTEIGYTYDDWKALPDDTVQVVMVYFNESDKQGRPKRRMMQGCDFYGFDGEQWTQNFDDRTKVQGHIKYGTYTTMENLERICREAIDDHGEGWLFAKPDIIGDKGLHH